MNKAMPNGGPRASKAFIPILCVASVVLGAAAWFKVRSSGTAPSSEAQASTIPAARAEAASAEASPDSPAPELQPSRTRPARSSAVVASAEPAPQPSDNSAVESSRALVAGLTELDPAKTPLTTQDATKWKNSLQQLISQKDAALPAILEFLQKNVDIAFPDSARKVLGFASLRLALLDAMQQIGGTAATADFLQILQMTADPVEVAILAKYVEQAEPGQHAEALASAARDGLNLAANGKLDGRDIAPLLEVLNQYGGAGAVADIQKAGGTWFDYAPIALASLPNGAGIPALSQWVDNPSAPTLAGNEIYLRMLAQSAYQYPDALEALMKQAMADRIPASAWQGIAEALTGSTLQLSRTVLAPSLENRTDIRTYHISSGNQNFLDVPPPPDMPPDQVNSRLTLIQQLTAVARNPTALQALEAARATLSSRLK